jgi:hypothetical protein
MLYRLDEVPMRRSATFGNAMDHYQWFFLNRNSERISCPDLSALQGASI